MIAILVGAAVAAVLHITVGWWLSPVGALIAGFMGRGRGAFAGTLSLVISWACLIAWSYRADPVAFAEMTRVVAGIIGGLPSATTVVFSICVASVLGLGAGMIGGAVRNIRQESRR